MFKVWYQSEAVAEMDEIRAHYRVRILDAIERQLSVEPLKMEGKKKRLNLGGGNFIYQLRVDEFRVFYDVDENERAVIVRHVRRKGRKTTGEIL